MQRLPLIARGRARIAGFLSAKKLPNLLVTLIFLGASTQLGLHFWPSSSLVYGVRVDYLSPTLYFLDFLIVAYLIARRSDLVGNPTRSDLTGTIPLLLTNLLFSESPLATLSWLLHVVLYFLFILSLARHALSTMYHVLPLTMLFQVVLAFLQVAAGRTLQGPLYYLGERMVSVGQPSVAVGEFAGEVVLRAYGTFGHPNVLAGWLVVCLLIIFNFSRSQKLSTKYQVLCTFLAAVGVVLTQSRAAALALFGLVIPFYLLRSLRARILYAALVLCTTYYALNTSFLTRDLDLSLGQRLTLQQISLETLTHFPFFGTGASASLATYPTTSPTLRLFQPDHNSFTLLLSWFGLFGILATLASLPSRFIPNIVYKILPLAPLLLLDHYFLTSPQGLFILFLYLKVVKIDTLKTQ